MKKILSAIGYSLAIISPESLLRIVKSSLSYIKSGYYKKGFRYIGKCVIISKPNIIQGKQRIIVGEKTSILEGVVLTAICSWRSFRYSPIIKIGRNVKIGRNCHITSINKITIKDNVLIGAYVTITDHAHGDSIINITPPAERNLVSKGEVRIGENVWIGDKVTILPNVIIGDGVIIGANSVVSKSLPSYTVCAGNPARIIKQMNKNGNR